MNKRYTQRTRSDKDTVINLDKFSANINSLNEKYKELPKKVRIIERRKKMPKVVDVINYFGHLLGLKEESFVSTKALNELQKNIINNEPVVMRHLHLIETVLAGEKKLWENNFNSEIIHTLNNTIWNIYFVKNNEDSNNIDKDFLGLAVYNLKFENDGKTVNLVSDKHKYKGNFLVNQENASVVKIRLKEQGVEQREIANQREITLFYSNKKAFLVEGFMITSTTDIIYNNSVLLEKNNDTKKLPTRCECFPIHSKDYYKVNPKIREYFKNIALNRNRTGSGGIRSNQGFELLLKEKNKINLPYKYDLYISAPITSLKNERQFQITQKLILGILNKLNKNDMFNDLGKIYSPATQLAQNNNLQTWTQAKKSLETTKRYEEALDKWKLSKYYMLVMPFDVPSVAMIQASWVFFSPADEIKRSVFLITDSMSVPAFMSDKHIPNQALYKTLNSDTISKTESCSEEMLDNNISEVLNEFQSPEIIDISSTFEYHLDKDRVKW